jgi:hypothetical protein
MASSSAAGVYDGEKEYGRYHGRGTYTFKGTTYVGNFVDGEFHGEGVLSIPGVGKYSGYWQNGKLASGGLVFSDGLEFKQVGQRDWAYCSHSDPRFFSEIKDNISNGAELRDITSHSNVDSLPKGCYDVIEGYYDHNKHAICSYDDGSILRMPDTTEQQWIVANCRVGKGEFMG